MFTPATVGHDTNGKRLGSIEFSLEPLAGSCFFFLELFTRLHVKLQHTTHNKRFFDLRHAIFDKFYQLYQIQERSPLTTAVRSRCFVKVILPCGARVECFLPRRKISSAPCFEADMRVSHARAFQGSAAILISCKYLSWNETV